MSKYDSNTMRIEAVKLLINRLLITTVFIDNNY